MLNIYDFRVNVGSLLPEYSHTKTYRIAAQDRESARQKMWKIVMTTTYRFCDSRIEWERHRGPYRHPQGMHDLEVRQALTERGTPDVEDTTPAFIYDIGDRIHVRHTGLRAKPDDYLTWDEFHALWTVVPGYYI